MMLRALTILALAMPMVGCMPYGNVGVDEDHMAFMHDHARHWPTVRIVGLDGARVRMKRGVFGDGLDVRAPFQGEFQPTAMQLSAGYPLEIDLDQDVARRYGADSAVRLRGSLLVPEHMRRHGILRIDVTECELRALLAGELDALKIDSDELPTPEMACSQGRHDGSRHESCACGREHARDDHREHCGMHRWHDMMGVGHGDPDRAVLMLAVTRPGDHPY